MEKLIQPTVVLIQDSVDGDREVIGLLFNCCWDTSHGMAVKFVEGELVKVGPQDIVL